MALEKQLEFPFRKGYEEKLQEDQHFWRDSLFEIGVYITSITGLHVLGEYLYKIAQSS